MKKIVLQCSDCEADFTVLHDMDEKMYCVGCCPFCGSELNEEPDEDDYEDEDWEENE